MTIAKTVFQPFVDWCTQPPRGILVSNLGAMLTQDLSNPPRDQPGTFYFVGTLTYRPEINLSTPSRPSQMVLPARFYGTLFERVGQEQFIVEIVLSPDVVLSLASPMSGPVFDSLDINVGTATIPRSPAPLDITFTTSDADCRLDIWEQRSIDWGKLRQRSVLSG